MPNNSKALFLSASVANSCGGACSGSTLKEASSWGKVDTAYEQMVYAETTYILALLASDAYHHANWGKIKAKNYNNMFN